MSEGLHDDYAGGTILQTGCPTCGRFVKIPKTYRITFKDKDFAGCFATTICKNCRKRVKLGVVFY